MQMTGVEYTNSRGGGYNGVGLKGITPPSISMADGNLGASIHREAAVSGVFGGKRVEKKAISGRVVWLGK